MINSLRVLWAGVRMQWRLALLSPVDFILASVLQPIFYTLLFLLLFKATGRLDSLALFGIIAPALIGMWSTALNVSGEIISVERSYGSLEILLIAPRHGLELSLFGRIVTVNLISLIAIVEAVMVAYFGFGIVVEIKQPLAFVALNLLAALSISSIALIMASTFVLSRSVRLFQNLLSFPFYLLGGLAVPVGALPQWLQPFSRITPLSWASEGLQQTLTDVPVSITYYLALALLTLVYGLIGRALLVRIQTRVRNEGSIGFSN
ncbi:MAG: ABC transporter permease [Anaerolineales bacterium]|nr:ABC transporter permease [Anaerolineales bacterium]MCB8954685.1 ABC transporter permease [Ardenticatenales bacterium]